MKKLLFTDAEGIIQQQQQRITELETALREIIEVRYSREMSMTMLEATIKSIAHRALAAAGKAPTVPPRR